MVPYFLSMLTLRRTVSTHNRLQSTLLETLGDWTSPVDWQTAGLLMTQDVDRTSAPSTGLCQFIMQLPSLPTTLWSAMPLTLGTCTPALGRFKEYQDQPTMLVHQHQGLTCLGM